MRAAIERATTFEIQTRPAASVKGEGLSVIHKAVPSVTISKWNGLASFAIEYQAVLAPVRQLDASAFAWDGVDHQVHAYDLSPAGILDEGGLELEVVLPALPTVNAWTFTLPNWQDYDIDYQAPLANLNADGSRWNRNPRGGLRQQPADVVGSLAIYARGRGGHRIGDLDFETGKVGHIFRPKVVDVTGRWEWGDLEYKAGLVTVTAPWSFLVGATFPVRVDPTFGYSGTAASDDNMGAARILCKATSTPASSGTLDSITIKGRLRTGTGATHEPAIYSDVIGVPTARLAAVNSGGTVYPSSDGEVLTAITYASLTSGVQYWLGSRDNSAAGGTNDCWFKYDASGGTANMYYILHVGAETDPWEATTAGYSSADNEKVYLYGTYTAAGGSDTGEWMTRSRIDRKQPVQVSY